MFLLGKTDLEHYSRKLFIQCLFRINFNKLLTMKKHYKLTDINWFHSSVCRYPFSCDGGFNLFGDQRGSILLNRSETRATMLMWRSMKLVKLKDNTGIRSRLIHWLHQCSEFNLACACHSFTTALHCTALHCTALLCTALHSTTIHYKLVKVYGLCTLYRANFKLPKSRFRIMRKKHFHSKSRGQCYDILRLLVEWAMSFILLSQPQYCCPQTF